MVAALVTPAPVAAQVEDGATMTVLRGQVAVIRSDGSAVQPAPSGTVVKSGDELRTLSQTGALITFFTGTEIEMGADTILTVDRVSKQGSTVDISLKQVLGVTLNRVQTLTDPNSSYRIEAGGATAVVRGTTFALIGPVPTSQGNIVALVCLADCDSHTTFNGCATSPFTALGAEVEHGKAQSGCDSYGVGRDADYFNEAAQAVTTFEQSFANGNGVSNPGNTNLGQERTHPEVETKRAEDQKEDTDTVASVNPAPSPPGHVTLSGLCTNGATSGSNCAITASNLNGGQVGGIPRLAIQTISSSGSVTTETNNCAPITSSLTSACNFTLSGRVFQGGLATLVFPLAAGGQDIFTAAFGCTTPRSPGQPC